MSARAASLLAIALLLAVVAWASGVFDRLQDIEAIRATVEAAGFWGPALYIVVAIASYYVFALSFPVWASVALWPIPIAFLYSFAASLLGSVLTYVVTFALGRNWARERVPQSLAAWEERLEARPIVALVTLRFLLWANPLVDMLLAVTRVTPRDYLIGTILGLLWPTAFQIAMGAGGGMAIGFLSELDLPWWQWTALGTALATLVAALWYRYRRQPA